MISCSSTLASSAPATSAKVILGVSPASSLALDFPKAKARLPPAWSWRSRKNQSPRITIQGSAAMMIAVMPPFGSLARMGTPASSSRLMNASLLATGRSTWKLLAVRPSWVTGRAEVALQPLAVEDLDPGDVALIELAAELGVGELLGRIALPAHHLEQRQRQQAHQQPEGQVLAQVAPVGARGSGGESVCHLFQVRDEREMTIVLGVVEPVADQKRRWRPEPDEAELRARLGRQLLVEQRADGQAPRPPRAQQRHQALQGLPGINNILDQEDMFALEPGFRVVEQADRPAGHLAVAVGAGHQEIDLDRPLDLPDQVAQEDEASLEQPEDQQLAVGIGLGDLARPAPRPAPRSSPRRRRST